jgi:hypothetical protein
MSTRTFHSNDEVFQIKKVKTLSLATVLTAGDSGTEFILDAAAGKLITLPALKEGLHLDFVVGAAFATDNFVVKSAEGDNITGFISSMGASVAGVVASAEDQVNFVASAETIGDHIRLVCDFKNSRWLLSGACGTNGGITATDPA